VSDCYSLENEMRENVRIMSDLTRNWRLSRRNLLQAAAVLPLAAQWPDRAVAQSAEMPPVLFVHGNGDSAALWQTQIWRMESNGVPRTRLMALNFTDPVARTDDTVPQPNRSSTEDQKRELAEAVAAFRQRTGAAKIALVANSRGGNSVRYYIKSGATDVSHAVLTGVPNHGVYAWDDGLNGEFNGRGPFLQKLNAGKTEATPGTAFLTLRSDGMDKYAQPDGRFVGKPGTPTNVTFEGPALTGATNLVLGTLDHREVGFHPRAFREMFKFIAGREPTRLDIVPEAEVMLSGLVTGTPGGVATNRPVVDAQVEIFRVGNDGARAGEPVYAGKTAADGKWGPAKVDPAWPLEFVLTQAGAPTTHIYRSPFPRSSDVVHLRAARPFGPADQGAGAIVLFSRPRGYFGLPRDVVLFDGKEPADVKPGVPTDSLATLRLPASEVGRPVVGLFNTEQIAARAWPAADNRISIAELTY
jgi:pimeloyl-ACP methyl ester carboxylesterase